MNKPKKKVVKVPGLKVGEPLANRGTCKHYGHSYRWLRFPCCGRAFPCDNCHNETVCVCVFICIYIFTFTFTFLHLHLHLHFYIYITFTFTFTFLHFYIYFILFICRYLSKTFFKKSFVCLHVCVCVCVLYNRWIMRRGGRAR